MRYDELNSITDKTVAIESFDNSSVPTQPQFEDGPLRCGCPVNNDFSEADNLPAARYRQYVKPYVQYVQAGVEDVKQRMRY